jgi:type III restriction enzyme
LLGRVLRMPYASPRGRTALNRAYAHVCEAKFSTAAHELADRLINNMGFEALDVASMVVQQSSLPLFDGYESNQPSATVNPAQVATNFAAVSLHPALMNAPGIELTQVGGEQTLVVTGHIGPEMEAQLVAQVRGPKKQKQVQAKVAQHNALVAAQMAPASRGVRFAPIPTLGYRSTPQGQLWPLEREAVLEAVELDLLNPEAVQLPGFQVVEHF